jgi:flagellar L-ring protein precursor FlgH
MKNLIALVITLAFAAAASAQSSSLYMGTPGPVTKVKGLIVNQTIQTASFTAVQPPQPRTFAVHDVITIVIRESSEATSNSQLNAKKEFKLDDKLTAFPAFMLKDLIEGRLMGGRTTQMPEVNLSTSHDFKGNGDFERKDTLTTRIAARVTDIKPNGILALEARTFTKVDDEESTITVTGMIRPDDVGADNTVLSTQMWDLRVAKTHTGELREVSKKGILTKILDTIFNF